MLDKAGLAYDIREYEYDENDLDGHHAAEQLGLPYEEVFKTLVSRADNGEYIVFCLSVDSEIDLKKAASVAGVKRIELIHVKELLPLTGYIRGGCSPIGMKKKFRTIVDEMVLLIDDIYFSGGQRGIQIHMKPQCFLEYLNAEVGDFTRN